MRSDKVGSFYTMACFGTAARAEGLLGMPWTVAWAHPANLAWCAVRLHVSSVTSRP